MADAQESHAPCPVSGEVNFSFMFTKDGSRFVRCKSCGLVCINPQPSDDDIRDFYSDRYYTHWGLKKDFESVADMKRIYFKEILEQVESYSNVRKGKILDIGCATGFFIDAAVEKGWDAYGVEMSSYSAALAQKRFGQEKIYQGTLEEASYRDAFYDAVFMADLIEHIKDVNAFLREVARILCEGGAIAILTPDIESLSRRLMGRFWPHYKPEHLYYFSEATISKLLERHGFKVVYIGPSLKVLSLGYIGRHFLSYSVPMVTPIIRVLLRLMPSPLSTTQVKMHSGELFIIARKKAAVDAETVL